MGPRGKHIAIILLRGNTVTLSSKFMSLYLEISIVLKPRQRSVSV